jgi:hypothetical protein
VPWDSGAETSAQGLGLQYANRQAGLSGDQTYEEEQTGIGANGANNPYSDAAMLKRQRDIGNRGAVNGAGNQLYAGSTVNAVRGVAGAYDRNLKGLEASFARNQELRRRQQQEAEADYQTGLGSIQESALDRAVESPSEPVAPGRPRPKPKPRKGRGR